MVEVISPRREDPAQSAPLQMELIDEIHSVQDDKGKTRARKLDDLTNRLCDNVASRMEITPSVWQATRSMIAGLNFVDRPVYEERMATCRGCEHSVQNELSKHVVICSKCGCLMSLKTRLRGSQCPVGKF